MTAKTLVKLIGRETTWTTRGITFDVEIADVREKFGRVDVLLSPTNRGVAGQVWVDLKKLPGINTDKPTAPKAGAVWKPKTG